MFTKQEKTVSAVSNGVIICYNDAKKHQFIKYVRDIQLRGTVKYQKIQREEFTPLQEKLYCQTVMGFEAYSQKELSSLTEQQKLDIKMNYAKVHRILKRWKQDLIFSSVDNFLLELFPKSSVAKAFANTKGYLQSNEISKEDSLTFKDLGISERKIADKLIEYNFLPQNFYELA